MATLMKIEENNTLTEDARLAREAIGNGEAFAELYRRHVTRVYRYHLAHTGDVKDAEDLASQTFMAALEGLRTYRASGSFAAWIMGIAARKRARFFRGRRREIPLDAALEIPSPGAATDRSASRKLQNGQILRALRQISPERAEALVLCFFSQLTPAEAGGVLGKSEAAVRMLISRGLNDLRTRTSLALEVEDE
jgi:RNA polymerase sigma-70 factor (ECF subfamily)